jgi:hypothetical protein
MTTPQDPNQPAGGSPPPASNLPAWGEPPPQQPGWGQQQPGWGQPQPGWGAGPPPRRSNRRGCLIGCLVVVVLLLVGIGGCTYVAWPYIQTDIRILQDGGTDRISSVSFSVVNSRTVWVVHLQPGHDADAQTLACTVVGPALRDSQFKNDDFEIVSSSGEVLATNDTPCP